MSVQEPTEQEIIDAVYGFAAEQMRDGVSPQRIEVLLVEKGLDQQSAATVVANLSELKSKALREAGQKDMLYGALWCIGGIVVTVATMSAASGGGTYVVAWGAIVFGAIQFFRGLTASGGD